MSAKVRSSQVCEDERAAAAAEQRRTGLPVSDCASGHEDGGAGANRVDGRCAWRSGEGNRQDWALPATRRARHEGRAAAVEWRLVGGRGSRQEGKRCGCTDGYEGRQSCAGAMGAGKLACWLGLALCWRGWCTQVGERHFLTSLSNFC